MTDPGSGSGRIVGGGGKISGYPATYTAIADGAPVHKRCQG